jgi:hypothetical protein
LFENGTSEHTVPDFSNTISSDESTLSYQARRVKVEMQKKEASLTEHLRSIPGRLIHQP